MIRHARVAAAAKEPLTEAIDEAIEPAVEHETCGIAILGTLNADAG
jgi:hypothetical protein